MRFPVKLFALFVVVACLCPASAWAEDLVLSGGESLTLAAVDIVPLPVNCSPESIRTGIPCGMTEMCGQDPCLCGSVDEWGMCACNGTEEVRPTWELSLDGDASGMVHLLTLGDRTYVASFGLGGASADGVLGASLVHFDDAEQDVHVEVRPFGVLDLLKVVVPIVLVAAVLTALGAGIRVLYKQASGTWRRRKDER